MKPIDVEIKKLVTMADIGLGVERPLNNEKRNWIKGLTKKRKQKPILVAPIKDSGYFILLDGWHRVQALKKQKNEKSTGNKSAGKTRIATGKGQQNFA